MFPLVCFVLIAFVGTASVAGKTFHVKTASELSAALKEVKSNDHIELADGEYHGVFVARGTGPITLSGSRKAILSSNTYGLHLEGCSRWNVKGFTIHNSKKGLVLDKSNNNIIDNIEVHHIDEEGIHFRQGSSDNVLQNSYVHNTGLKAPGFGEGVYIGSAVSLILCIHSKILTQTLINRSKTGQMVSQIIPIEIVWSTIELGRTLQQNALT